MKAVFLQGTGMVGLPSEEGTYWFGMYRCDVNVFQTSKNEVTIQMIQITISTHISAPWAFALKL